MGNAIVAARSAAAFYSDKKSRYLWLSQFLRDISDTNDVNTISLVYPNLYKAILDYCSGDTSVQTFRNTAFSRNTNSFHNLNGVALDDNILFVTRVWECAVERLIEATNNPYPDTELKIEFERVYNVDATSGALSNVNFYNDTVTTAESLKAIAPLGFLNKGAVFNNDSAPENVHYNSYIFGSNLLLIDNSLTNYGVLDSSIPSGTDKRHLQRVLNMNDTEIERFISNIVTVSGGTVRNCPRYGGSDLVRKNKAKHKRGGHRLGTPATDEGGLQFISFDKLSNSIKFTFATRNQGHYFMANLFILKADDFCTNDLVYRRTALTSLCQCDRPTLAWRICIFLTPITATTLEGPLRDEVLTVVMSALTAFRSVYAKKKQPTSDSRVAVLSGFLGLPIPTYVDDETRPRHDKNEIDHSKLTPLCVFHRWLRAHCVSNWIPYNGDDAVLRLLDKQSGGRAVIVKRPLFTAETDGFSLGTSAFVRYMSYEDVVNKTLRLTKQTLMYGLSDSNLDENCAVAYMRSPNDLVVFKGPVDRTDGTDEEREERDSAGGTSALWKRLFQAPTYLYIDFDVLTTMGFNPTSVSPTGRTFVHVDENTGDACTVFCSVLLRVVNDDANKSKETQSPPVWGDAAKGHGNRIQVLYNETPYDSRLDPYRAYENADINGQRVSVHQRYIESVYDVSAFWPTVHLVRIDFTDPELKHIVFAFFTGRHDSLMSLENLHGFSRLCVSKDILPAPILYTIQKDTLNAVYA